MNNQPERIRPGSGFHNPKYRVGGDRQIDSSATSPLSRSRRGEAPAGRASNRSAHLSDNRRSYLLTEDPYSKRNIRSIVSPITVGRITDFSGSAPVTYEHKPSSELMTDLELYVAKSIAPGTAKQWKSVFRMGEKLLNLDNRSPIPGIGPSPTIFKPRTYVQGTGEFRGITSLRHRSDRFIDFSADCLGKNSLILYRGNRPGDTKQYSNHKHELLTNSYATSHYRVTNYYRERFMVQPQVPVPLQTGMYIYYDPTSDDSANFLNDLLSVAQEGVKLLGGETGGLSSDISYKLRLQKIYFKTTDRQLASWVNPSFHSTHVKFNGDFFNTIDSNPITPSIEATEIDRILSRCKKYHDYAPESAVILDFKYNLSRAFSYVQHIPS